MIVKKTEKGSYQAVLSSDSIDCDDEIISPVLLDMWASRSFVLPMLTDHMNSIDHLVGQWIDKQVVTTDANTYLYARPQFISKCNPRGDKIKATLDDGIPLGVSIGFIPTDFKDINMDGRSITEWTEGKLLEASWTPVPANSDAYGYVAKSLKIINSIPTKEITKDNRGDIMAKKDDRTKTPDATGEPDNEPVADAPANGDDNQPDQPTATPDEPTEPSEPSDANAEKSVDIDSMIAKATTDMNTKLSDAIKVIKKLETDNASLKTRIDKLETEPVHRALIDNPNKDKSGEPEHIKQEDLSMSRTIFAKAQD